MSSFSGGREERAPERESLSWSVEALRRWAGCLLLGDAAAAAAAATAAECHVFNSSIKSHIYHMIQPQQQRAACQLHHSDKRQHQQLRSAFYCYMGKPNELV